MAADTNPAQDARALLDMLDERCQTSDDCQYGTLGTSFVRDFIRDMRAAIEATAQALGLPLEAVREVVEAREEA